MYDEKIVIKPPLSLDQQPQQIKITYVLIRRPNRVTEYFDWPFLSEPFERKIPLDFDRLSNNTSESVSESDIEFPRVTDFMGKAYCHSG